MNISVFILILLFIGIIGICYILSELNITYSSYLIRMKKQNDVEFNTSYYNWFILNENKLIILYEQEICENMSMNFDQFCLILYKGGTINYF
jgi:hypothetical protein